MTGVLKNAVKTEKHGVAICGGKGKVSRKAPNEIRLAGEKFGFSKSDVNRLVYSSK